MNLEESISNLLKKVQTPSGALTLYGINILPNSDTIGLIFYIENKQIIHYSIDCHIITNEQNAIINFSNEKAEPIKRYLLNNDNLNKLEELYKNSLK